MEKRNRRRVNVTGVVIAVSHILLSSPSGFFVKIFQTKPLCIRVLVQEQFHWLKSLRIGVTYRFSKLFPKELNSGTNESVQFVDATIESVLQEIPSALPKPLQDICSALVSFTGSVSNDSFASLGLYELYGGETLCTSFMAHKVCIESFKSGDFITIYNAHEKNVHGSKYLVMCAGSYAVSQTYLEIIPAPKDSSGLHPVVAFALEKGWGFEDFLWLTKIFSKLKNVMGERLIVGDESHRKYIFDLLNYLIFNQPASSETIIIRSAFMKEFLMNDHKCAAFVAPKHPDLRILTIEDCTNQSIVKETSEKFWEYKLDHMINSDKNGTTCFVIGRLDVEEGSPFLTLSDGVTKMRCVPIGDSDRQSNLRSYLKKTVMVRKAVMAVEHFRLPSAENGVHFEKYYNYMILYLHDLHPICDSLGNVVEVSRCSKESSKSLCAGGSHFLEDANVEISHFSQYIVLHHVSTPFIYDTEKQFYCLVSLLGHPVESRNSSDSYVEKSKEKGRLCVLCMKKHMFHYYPFLFENRVYEIKYPKSYGMHLFDKRVNFTALATGCMFLPLTEGVIVPCLSTIMGPFTSPNLPVDSLMNKEIYRIRDVQDVAYRDVIHVQGIAIFRSHQPAKYPRKRRINDDVYGVPVEQNIVLELRDEEVDAAIRIYLIAFAAKFYPLGLLPGSRVRLTFVEKRISGQKNVFYQSTCFTNIMILECPKVLPLSESEILLDNTKRHSYIAKELESSCFLQSPFWGIISISKIWKFEVLAFCQSCNSQIRYGRCTYVGCSNLLKEPLVSANANFLVEDGSGEAFMNAKDENVRKLLGFSVSEWKELGDIASKKELLFDSKKYWDQKSGSVAKADADQAVFNRLGAEVELKPWHILCRKFYDQGNEGRVKLFCLDVQEIDFARAETLSS